MAKNDKRVEVKQLISLGKEKGYLTYEEVHDVLPPDVVSPEHIDALMTLGDLDIDLVDPESPPDGGLVRPRTAWPRTTLRMAGPSIWPPMSWVKPTTPCACICVRWGPFRC